MAKQQGQQIKKNDTYVALRKQGNSKEKSARIANAQANTDMHPSQKGGKAEKYEKWTKADLYKRAKALDISGRSKMNKDDLIKALRSS